MDIENKQTQINTFTGGMNTDVSDALLKPEQYKLAANLRLVTSEDGNTGELHQIQGAAIVASQWFDMNECDIILGATQIRDIGVIIAKSSTNDHWSVVKFQCEENLPEIVAQHEVEMHRVFGPCEEPLADNKLSLVTRYEDEDNIKLYIADGEHPIMIVNLAKDYGNNTDINQIISYPKAIFKKPIFCGLVSGSLKAGVVEYSYQFYNDGGNYSEISPSTKLISIHKGNASNASGYPKDTITNRGVSLKFDLSENDNFDSLRIYRIMYTESGQLPTIEVIYENKLPDTDVFSFIDAGQKAITTLTLEEYNSATGIHIIPRTIESKDDYMFASNIKTDARLDSYDVIRNWDSRAFQCDADGYYKIINRYGQIDTIKYRNGDWQNFPDLNDDCINPDPNTYLYSWGQNGTETYFGGNGPNVSWRFVRTSLDGDSTSAGFDLTYGHHGSAADSISYAASNNKFNSSNINARYITLADIDITTGYSQQPHEITIDLSGSVETDGEETRNYGNEKVTYSLKSLRRGETYRYGIVLYSDKGESTGVKWIADIKVPEMHTKNFNTFLSHKNGIELEVYPLGIEFNVDISEIVNNIDDDVHIIGYEIVRCPRTESDIRAISQGVLSRPCAKFIDPGSQSSQKIYPLTPTGWLTTCGYWAGGYLLTNYSPYDISEQEDVNNIQGWQMTNNYFNPSELSYESGSSPTETKILGTATFMYGNPSQSWTSMGSLSCTFVADATKQADEEFDSANIAFYRPTEAVDVSGKTVFVYNTDSGCVMKANSGLNYTGEVVNIQTNNTVKAKINNSAFRFVLGDHFFNFSTFGSNATLGTPSTFIANNSSSEQTSGYFGNYSVYQFVSPEVSYLRQSMRDLIVDNVNVSPQMFLFGTTCDSDGSFADRQTNTAWTITGGDGSKYNHIYKMPNPMGVNPGGNDYDGTPDWDRPAEGQHEKNGTPPNPNMVKGLFMYPGNTYTKIPLNGSYGQPGCSYSQRNGKLSPMIRKEVVCRQACMYNYMTTYTYYEDGTSNFSNTTDAGKRSGFYDNVQKGKFSQAHQYIKLYEQTDKVVRNNLQNAASFANPFNKVAYRTQNGFVSLSSLGSSVTGEQEENIDFSDITVSRVAFPDTLGWDDFNDATSDANQNFRVTYSDKTTPIGTDSYNNWVSSGMWGIGFNEITPSKANMSYAKKDIIDRYYSGMGGVNGPAGSCVLLKLDVNSHNQISNTTGACNIYESFGHGNSQYAQCNIKYASPSGVRLLANVDNIPNTQNYIYRESALGTYLVNITRNVTPYGGADFAHRQSNTYNSYGDYFEFEDNHTSTSYVFDGDCFIQPFEYTSLHKMASGLKYAYSVRTANITYAIPVETNINIAYEHGYAFSKNGSNPLIQEQPSDVNGQFIQDTPQYVYNGVYSTNTLSKSFAAEEDFDRISSQQNFDYRTYHSNPKINNEALDSWIKYMPANHLDVDTRFGPITGLRTFGNKLVYWQSSATGLFSVNERTQITDSNNLPLILGTGGILTRYDYVSQQNGMHINQYADTQSNAALYWFDYDKHELCMMAHDGSVAVLSKAKGVQNYLNKIADRGDLIDMPTLVYDSKFNEVLAYIGGDWDLYKKEQEDDYDRQKETVSLVYNENQQVFTAIYTIPIVERCVFTNNLYIVGDQRFDSEGNISRRFSQLSLWNKRTDWGGEEGVQPSQWYGEKLLFPYVKYVINEIPTVNKTFDTFKFGGRFYGGDQLEELSVSKRQPLKDDYPSINQLRFEFYTPLKQHGMLLGTQLENIEYDFRGAIPRNGQEWDREALFGDRLRGKTMQCEMYSRSSDYDFSLQYIATKYRVSWT